MERLVRVRTLRSSKGGRRPLWPLRSGRQIGAVALLLILAVFGLTGACECAPVVSASLDPMGFGVDEAATLTVTVSGGSGTIDEMVVVDGLEFQGRGQSRQHQFINGSLSSFSSTLFQVQAARPGTFTIPPIPVTVDGKQLTTAPITFEVTTAADPLRQQQGGGMQAPPSTGTNQAAGDADQAEQMAFLRVSPVKEASYTGELLPLQIKAYFRRGLRASLNSHPSLNGDGVVLTLPNQEPVQTEELVGNAPFSVLTWNGSVSGIKEGAHSVSVGLEATALIRDSRRRAPRNNSGNDPFFGNDPFADFFNQQPLQEKKIQLVSLDMPLAVRPLPVEGKPADFNGAIGSFDFQAQAQPVEVGPGDPITLTMTVTGTGNFDRVEAPVLSRSEGWKTYAPSSKFSPGASPGQGSKVFTQAIIAKAGDAAAIPPLTFSFFDPEAGQYRTVESAPIPLRVSKGAGTGKGAEAETKEVPASKTTPPSAKGGAQAEGSADTGLILAPQHQQIGALHRNLSPLVDRTGFQVIILGALLLLASVFIWKIRAGRLAANPILCRKKEMAHLLDGRLLQIQESRERGCGHSPEFLTLCRQTMQEQLGFLWRIEPAAITLADLRQRLAPDAELVSLFATAESGAYGGCLLQGEEMTEYVRRLEKELRQLQCG
jgi:hypothetical protein